MGVAHRKEEKQQPYTEDSPLYGCFSSFLWATQRGGRFEISKQKTIHSVRGSRRCSVEAKSGEHCIIVCVVPQARRIMIIWSLT